METDPKDLSRGMAPSETMKKVSAIDPMGLLGDHADNDQEMREVEDIGSASDANPSLHKNVHVISASEGEGSEGGIQGDGSEPDNSNILNNSSGGAAGNQEKAFRIVDIEKPAALPSVSAPLGQSGGETALSESALMPPPAARTTPVATQVPDPDLVNKMFQRMGENGSQQAATPPQMNTGQGTKNIGNQKN